jgi:glutathione S-transferase
MKLYYTPDTCSFAAHLVLAETARPYGLERVDLKTKRTRSGEDFRAINPGGYVPVLGLANAERLTEAPAILQYLADLEPELELAPPNGTLDRVKLQSLLNFASAELHKAFGVFFAPVQPRGELREFAIGRLTQRLDLLEHRLADGGAYLMGDRFTVADAYTAVVASWVEVVGLDRRRWGAVADYVGRVMDRPSARAAERLEARDARAELAS